MADEIDLSDASEELNANFQSDCSRIGRIRQSVL